MVSHAEARAGGAQQPASSRSHLHGALAQLGAHMVEAESPTVDVVIVNWNTGHHLSRALSSLRTAKSARFRFGRVVVVDNGSTDGSERSDFGQFVNIPLTVVRNQANIGFAAACNQGARESTSEYILFLNPDVELNGGSLDRPVGFLEADNSGSYGICGVRLVDERGIQSESCARFPTPGGLVARSAGLDHLLPRLFPPHFHSRGEAQRSGPVDQVIGAFFLTRRRVFRQLGGFDERFFVYFEELDFSLRASQAGIFSYYLAEATATHCAGTSSRQIPTERLVFSWRSRVRYAFKHFPHSRAVAVLLATLTIEPPTRLAWALVRGSGMEIRATVRATARFWRELPQIGAAVHPSSAESGGAQSSPWKMSGGGDHNEGFDRRFEQPAPVTGRAGRARDLKGVLPWYAKIAGKLVLERLPVPYRFWKHVGLIEHGSMEDPAYGLQVFLRHSERYSRRPGGNLTALELGPGDSLLSGVLAYAFGFDRTYLIDVGPFAIHHVPLYRRAVSQLAAYDLRTPPAGSAETPADLMAACGITYLTRGIASLRSIPDCSVDFAWSHAVLEHVRRGEFFPTLVELRRILRGDGVSSHSVDLMDHLARSLNSLRVPERIWESELMAACSFYTNRIRYEEMLSLFREVGFGVNVVDLHRWAVLPTPRRKLKEPYRNLSEDDLSVSSFDVVLRKP